MTDTPPLPIFAAIVVAAGQGLRAGQAVPKQFANWRGKPLVRHCIESLSAAGAEPIVVVIPEGGKALAAEALAGLPVRTVNGGATRQASVACGLRALGDAERVAIHDAARPGTREAFGAVLRQLLERLSVVPGAIPVLPVVDSLAKADQGKMVGSAPRERLRRVQTPQAFRYADIVAAHADWSGAVDAGDDAQVLLAAGGEVALVEGDEALNKLTFAEDFMTERPAVRIGTGFDVHRLVTGEELWLGGIRIAHDKGLAGHSDADVLIHALVDALLGAIGDGDIGTHFPPSDQRWKDASSDKFLAYAADLVSKSGYAIGNVDCTVICEEPKIGPYRPAIRARLAELLGVDLGQVSVKATTTERLGFTGRGEGIAAQAAATLIAL